jgi:prepilin-type N-terminal cleavage/methylation domain-containing protein
MNPNSMKTRNKIHTFHHGFSMVEMLAAVAIMGVIAFMAIPSVTRMRADSERNLAIARAEALNIAQANFIQTQGRSRAELIWQNATTPQNKYNLIRPYLGFSEASLAGYMPGGYSVAFPESVLVMQQAVLTMQMRDPLVPGSPLLPINYRPDMSSEPVDYRARFSGGRFQLLPPGTPGTGLRIQVDGSDLGEPVVIPPDFNPYGF